jgi:hypothetical protein
MNSLSADAAFAKPEIYEALEERGVKYVIRIPANDSLERDIAELLTGGLVQELSVPGSELEDGVPRGGQGGVPRWGVVPSGGIHRDQPGNRQPGGGAVL